MLIPIKPLDARIPSKVQYSPDLDSFKSKKLDSAPGAWVMSTVFLAGGILKRELEVGRVSRKYFLSWINI
jgi:hypothetical protein